VRNRQNIKFDEIGCAAAHSTRIGKLITKL